MNKALILLILTFVFTNVDAQTKVTHSPTSTQNHIKWYSMDDALKMSKKSKKKILIDFYTDWCGWCKRMDKATYENPEVAQYINKYFIPVKFNAEREKDIMFKGRNYTMKQAGIRKTHELAITLLSGKMGYPTTTLLDSEHNMIQNIPGYIQANEMVIIAKYFGSDYHKKMPYPEFKQSQQKAK